MDTPQASTAPIVTTVAPSAEPAPATVTIAAPAAPPPAADKPVEPAGAAAPEKKPIDVARGFAAIAAEERRVRAEREAVKAEKAQLVAARDQLIAARKDPRAAMRLLGHSEEAILESIAGNGTAAPTDADRVAALEQREREREQRDAAATERAKQAATAAQIDTFFSNVAESIKKAGDTYELINAESEHAEVRALIEGHVARTGKLMPWEQAAKLVEDQLREQEQARIARWEKKKAAAAPPPAVKSEKKTPSETGAATTTLNNRGLNGGSARVAEADDLPLDPDERTAEMNRRRAARRAS